MYLVESPEDVLTLNVKNEARLSFMTQTTLSVDDTSDVIDALRQRFPKIVGPRKDDICYATTNRQEAVRALAEQADVVLVVGSKNSSNSNRLAELAQRMGKAAFLIDDATDIQEAWVKNAACVGVTAGASAPDILVQNDCPSAGAGRRRSGAAGRTRREHRFRSAERTAYRCPRSGIIPFLMKGQHLLCWPFLPVTLS
jgi:(E)-4-hydroxy-3-methyl-but-2-enyl pyrophosphate reductase